MSWRCDDVDTGCRCGACPTWTIRTASLSPCRVGSSSHRRDYRQSSGGKGSVWLFPQPEGDEYEILLPLSTSLRDYVIRVSEAIHTLAAVEDRSELDVLNDLAISSADIVRIRSLQPDTTDGTIAIEEGVRLMQHAQDLMLSAACAAVQPRAYYQTRKPGQAIEYLRQQVRLGQTERGSYVARIISRLSPALDSPVQGMLFPDPSDPFERRVTRTLAAAVAATRAAAARAAATLGMEPFREAVPVGVSANLCDALAGMAEGAGSLQIEFSWSRARPAPRDVPQRVVLESDAMPLIREAGRVFRETSAFEEFEVQDIVTKLDRERRAVHTCCAILMASAWRLWTEFGHCTPSAPALPWA